MTAWACRAIDVRSGSTTSLGSSAGRPRRARLLQCRLRLAHPQLEIGRDEPRQHVSLRHAAAQIHRQLHDPAGHLEAHFRLLFRGQSAGHRDGARQVDLLHGGDPDAARVVAASGRGPRGRILAASGLRGGQGDQEKDAAEARGHGPEDGRHGSKMTQPSPPGHRQRAARRGLSGGAGAAPVCRERPRRTGRLC